MDDIKPKSRPKLQLPSDKPIAGGKNKKSPAFTPPDKITERAVGLESPKLLKPKNKRFNFKWPQGKKQWIIFCIILVLVLGSLVGWLIARKSGEKPVSKPTPVVKAAPPKPTTEASKLSGLTVPIGTNEKQVTAVMIENSPDARPQAGLKDSPVIFEAIAEGGITRFAALYQDTEPDYIGPIRSVRPYYIDWILPFDAAIAHVGGSPRGLSDIKDLSVKDLDQFANSGAYERISSRYAPHNVYSSIAKLSELEKNKGYNSSKFDGFIRKKEQPLATPMAKTIDINISSYYYNVHYDYDATNNNYLRSEGGSAHKDDRSGNQLAPKVVVVIVMSRGIDSDGQHTDYSTVGSGKTFLFQDGYITEGNWSKESRQAQWKFTEANGKELAFNPGQTWLTIVDAPGSVSYK